MCGAASVRLIWQCGAALLTRGRWAYGFTYPVPLTGDTVTGTEDVDHLPLVE